MLPLGDRDPAVVAALQKLNEATERARRSGETFRDTGAGAEMREAYDAWMCARAAAGVTFALRLGYAKESD